MTDGIGRVAAVVENVGHGFEAGNGLVLPESYEQVGKRCLRNVAGVDGFSEGDEDGMAGFAAIAGVKLISPEIEQRKGRIAVAGFVSEVVGYATVGIDRVEVRPEALGQKP